MHTPVSVFPLRGTVQHYSWGGFTFIPQLLGIEGSGKPYAEYWLGAHPSQPAEINVHGELKKLNLYIEANKEMVLGPNTAARFGELPYLMKVLDVRQMLSIQVHPDKVSAEKAFVEENRQGIPLNAPNRNYKDRNHKPELMVALGDFWLLHGFKPEQELREVLETVPPFSPLIPIFESSGYQGLYQHIMMLSQDDVNAVLQPLLTQLAPLYQNGELLKSSADFWAARAAQTFCKDGKLDRGIFSIYFFNLLHLKKGEGIYQPAGLPHAYLDGQNIEIMAASDNVLRAGLTDKHIDIDELMKHVRFEPTVANILPGSADTETVYKSAAAEFELSQITLREKESMPVRAKTAEILLLVEGSATIEADQQLALQKGDAVLLQAGTGISITTPAGAIMFRASVPDGEKN